MSEIIQSSQGAMSPSPRVPISIRPATIDDLAFIDGLQKKHTKQVGFMPTKQFEGKIKAGHVFVAEEGSGSEQFRKSASEESDSMGVLDAVFMTSEPPNSERSCRLLHRQRSVFQAR